MGNEISVGSDSEENKELSALEESRRRDDAPPSKKPRVEQPEDPEEERKKIEMELAEANAALERALQQRKQMETSFAQLQAEYEQLDKENLELKLKLVESKFFDVDGNLRIHKNTPPATYKGEVSDDYRPSTSTQRRNRRKMANAKETVEQQKQRVIAQHGKPKQPPRHRILAERTCTECSKRYPGYCLIECGHRYCKECILEIAKLYKIEDVSEIECRKCPPKTKGRPLFLRE